MLSAQDEAFVRLGIERGALAAGVLPQLAAAPTSHQSAVQIVVDQGWLSSLEATALLREVMSLAFGCPSCGWRTAYEGLATRSTFACPCGGGLVPLPPQRASSGSFPLPTPDASRGPEDSDFVRQAFGSTRFRSAAELVPGQVLGGYQLQRELGRGANGVVFLARRPGLEREFALKILLEDTTPDAETVARFQLEAAIGSKLRDPGVISVYDVGRVGDFLYYAMEYSPGQDLKEVLRERGRLPWEEGVELCRQLAETLAHCHDRSVIHRDLKPGNIILDTELNRPRVTDFGLARDRTLAQTMTATGDWLGTPYYMSPEQFRGETDLDHRADIYALGTILFEVLTGERPYVAKSAQELMELVLEGRAPSPRSCVPELPLGLDHIVARAMASDPEDRYPDARELAEDLAAVLAGKRLAPQRTRLAAGVFLAAAALFAATAVVYHQRDRAPAPSPVASAAPSEASPSPQATPSRAQGYDWAPLLADWKTWTGGLDLAGLKAVQPPLSVERLAALEATRELGLAARASRGAPWSDLKSILKRARGPEDWIAFQSRLDLLEARLLLARGRSRAALLVLDKRRSPQALWLRALAHEAAGDATQAGDLLVRLAKGEGPESALAKARRMRSSDEPQGALALIEAAGEIPEAKLELAEVLLAAGDGKRAGPAIEAYLERSGPSPRALRIQGELALARGEVSVALSALQSSAALLEEDSDPKLVDLLGRALLRADRNSDAVQVLSTSIPPARKSEALSPFELRFLVQRGLAQRRLGAKSRAKTDWSRAGSADAAAARQALPQGASQEERAALDAAISKPSAASTWEGPQVAVIDWDAELEALGGFMGGKSGAWRRLRALGKLPAQTARRFAVPEDGTQAERDLAVARRASAEGKPWADVRFYLTRALESGQAQEKVRATWMSLARGRVRDLEAVAKRLAEDPARYGLKPSETPFALAEMAWFQGRAGEALRGYDAIREGGQGRSEPSVLLASAHAALLRGEFSEARGFAERLGSEHEDGRGFALAGLASLALNQHAEAAKSQRAAYALLGASDYRILALRAGLSAGNSPSLPLLGSTGEGAEARTYLQLAGRPAELLALRVLAESKHKDLLRFSVEQLSTLKEVELAELKQFRGYSWVRLKKERGRCLKAWREARGLDSALPLPKSYLEAFAQAYGTEEGLEDLR